MCYSLVGQTVIYVDKDASEGGDGSNWSSAFKYLQDALDASVEYSEIWIAEGTYFPDEGANFVKGDRSASFYIKNGISLYGGFSGNETSKLSRDYTVNITSLSGEIFDDQTYYSANLIDTGNNNQLMVFDGLIMEKTFGGTSASISIRGSQITNCTFRHHSSQSSPLFFTANVVKNSTFNNNTGEGGVFATSALNKFINSKFINNSGSKAGVFYQCPLNTIYNSFFIDNYSNQWAGIQYSSDITYHNCFFYGNWGSNGASFSIQPGGGSTAKFINCTVYFATTELFRNGDYTFINTILISNFLYSSWTDIFNGVTSINNSLDAIPTPSSLVGKNIFIGGLGAVTSNLIHPDDLIHYSEQSKQIRTDRINEIFINPNNPIGDDGIWGTDDDGFRLKENSPAIGMGESLLLPADELDIDNDENAEELLPNDIAGFSRHQDESIDLGCYEFGNQKSLVQLTILSNTGGYTLPAGVNFYSLSSTVNISATANPGYLFQGWSGSLQSSTPNITVNISNNYELTANFAEDLNDDDLDGLSNYDESVIYNTNPNAVDTSGDGLSDKYLVDSEFDPNTDYSLILRGKYTLAEIADLRAGSTMIQIEDGQAVVRLQMEESSDLQVWEDTGDPATMTVPMRLDSDTKFIRFKMAE